MTRGLTAVEWLIALLLAVDLVLALLLRWDHRRRHKVRPLPRDLKPPAE